MKQFNGKYGCSTCTHPGTRLSNNARVYLPTTRANPRTHHTIMAAAKEAEIFGISVRGIKGVSVLATSLDLVNSVPVDCMHAVLEGVVRLLLHAWFDSENHREAFYLGCSGRQIDKLLLQQCPPHEFTHPPRSVLNHRNYWKASELRNWPFVLLPSDPYGVPTSTLSPSLCSPRVSHSYTTAGVPDHIPDYRCRIDAV